MHSHTNTVANSICHPVYRGSVSTIQERLRHWAENTNEGWYFSYVRDELLVSYGFLLSKYKDSHENMVDLPIEQQQLFILFIAEALPDLI